MKKFNVWHNLGQIFTICFCLSSILVFVLIARQEYCHIGVAGVYRNTVRAVCNDWASAQVQNYAQVCSDPEYLVPWQKSDDRLTVKFKDHMDITVKNDGTITLNPEMLMASQTLSSMFLGYKLPDGHVLKIWLDDGITIINILKFGDKLYVSIGKG